MWHAMRTAAIARHRLVNAMFEGGCPYRWIWHMAAIKAVYGY